MELRDIKLLAEKIRGNVSRVIVGKEDIIDLSLICIITGGHMLLEDVPGTGKTVFARALAASVDCSFRRIQFTPDLLPSDVTGINFYNQKENEFTFRAGPVFSNILLADEINRATPRTQSAMLECMEERQVTIDGETRLLSVPFLVIATQNPVEIQGTFPLPEAQLDRFLIKTSMGYPDSKAEIDILKRFKEHNPLAGLSAVVSSQDIAEAYKIYSRVRVSEDVFVYIAKIAEASRKHSGVHLGISPRGSQALLKTVQVKALLDGRSFATPDDVKAMAVPVLAHRIIPSGLSGQNINAGEKIIKDILAHTEVPLE
ncbi:MoxR-like ATPase [Ruminiclostridium sufflavum DSM 19573]|uniref:MoxR-like ATPase n=1 Tax=Ruminiclostridium sufflavum DSM 19573 TaxID=1121337 RepID=A0A318XMY9_9FIRM|nr:MoxR family ATPase [Ruminiclostridium sufflavum]PYG87307.1 MoxR-like ATPase [Ruminiclostridium sufflavum DSM 19573]